MHALVLVLLIFRGMHVGKLGAKCKDFKEYVHKCLNKLGLEDRISEVCMSVWCPTCVPLCKYVGSVASPPFVFFFFICWVFIILLTMYLILIGSFRTEKWNHT